MSDRGKFVWHDLISTDLAASAHFYGELFGWKSEEKEISEGNYVHFRLGEKVIGGMMKAPPGVPQHWIGYVGADDTDEVVKKAKATGGHIQVAGMDIDVGRFAALSDPLGIPIATFHHTKPPADAAAAAPVAGVFVWDELHTPNPDKDKAFYEGLFGWTVATMEVPGFGSYSQWKAGDVMVGGLMKSQEGAYPHWLAYVSVDNDDKKTEEAFKLGAKVMAPPMEVTGVGRISILTDPQRAPFALIQPAPRTAQ